MTLSTATLTITELLSDGELITASRGGDGDAYAELYRRHRPAAFAAARSLTRSRADSEDLVAEGFARVLKAVQRGGGPELAFRAYLLTAVRNTFYDRVRRNREEPTEQIEDSVNQALLDFADDSSDRALAAKAFATLPERWQMVLWHTEVEGRSAAEVAPLIGLAPNAVSALAYRAREGLRQAYLQVHLQDQHSTACAACVENLGAYVRDGLASRDRVKVDEHLAGCADCTRLLAELQETNSTLRAALIPALVGVPAVAFLGKLSTGTLAGWYQRQPPQSQAAAGVGLGTAVVAASVAVILAVGGGQDNDRIEAAPASLETTTTAQVSTTTSTIRPGTSTSAETTAASTSAETVPPFDTVPEFVPSPPIGAPIPIPAPGPVYRPTSRLPSRPTPRPPTRPTTGPTTGSTTESTTSSTSDSTTSTSAASSASSSTSTTEAPILAANLVLVGQPTLSGSTVTFTLKNSGGQATIATINVDVPAGSFGPSGQSAAGYTLTSTTPGVTCTGTQTCQVASIPAGVSVEIALVVKKSVPEATEIWSATPATVKLTATDANGKTVAISATGTVRRDWRTAGSGAHIAGMTGAGQLSVPRGATGLIIAWRENSSGNDVQLKQVTIDGTDVAIVGAGTAGQGGTYYAYIGADRLPAPSVTDPQSVLTQSIKVNGGFVIDWGVVALLPGPGTVVVPGVFANVTPDGPALGDILQVQALVLGGSVSSIKVGEVDGIVSNFVGLAASPVLSAATPPVVVNPANAGPPLGLLVYHY